MVGIVRRHIFLFAILVWAAGIGVIWMGVGLFLSSLTPSSSQAEVELRVETREEVYSLPCGKADLSTPWAIQEEARRRSLIDPLFPIRVEIGDRSYAIPYAYFASSIPSTRLNCEPLRGASLQYWIPSLDAPTGKIIYETTNRPADRNRPEPQPNESVVHVFRLGPLDLRGTFEGRRRTRAEWEIYRSRSFHGPETLSKEYGLWKTPPSPGSLKTVDWYREGSDETTVISCSGNFDRCHANVDLADLGLSVRFIFARDAVPQHEIIVAGLRELLGRWRTDRPAKQ
jgi:hypothetical protein